MPRCSWSLLRHDADRPDDGPVVSDGGGKLVVTFQSGGKISVAPADDDGKTVSLAGEMLLKNVGDVRLVGGVDIDTSGATAVNGKLVFNLSPTSALDLHSGIDLQTGEVNAGAALTIRF